MEPGSPRLPETFAAPPGRPLAQRSADMVPGMTERDQLAADMRRAEWLAEALDLGTAKIPTAKGAWRHEGRPNRAPRFLLTMARAIGDTVGRLRLASRRTVPARGGAQPR